MPDEADRLSVRARPRGTPVMRQNWGKLLFMHWPVEAELLRPLIPSQLSIDTFEGRAWIAIAPFTMWGVRPIFTPSMPRLSALHELNVRTYVHLNGVPGVWFFSLDAASPLAVWGARRFFHLPYFNARMSLEREGQTIIYASQRTHAGAPPARFKATWTIGESLPQTQHGELAFFLTERYCLYAAHQNKLYRARIAHQPWPFHQAQLKSFDSTMIESHGLPTPSGEPLLHYAEALKVDVWWLEEV